jgi:outer membrane receptor protein involved in Fe transport
MMQKAMAALLRTTQFPARAAARAAMLALALLPAYALAQEAEAAPEAVPAQEQAPELSVEDLRELSLEELLEVQVVTASKQSESLSTAPAIVSVITADEIATWGARSVAEALMYVPGVYPVYDFVSHNVGVRGINGGLGAYGRIIKVMINGQPVSFRSNAANYLGPEFLPIEAIERIEVVRGPASALYGANAFLGVINIITKAPAQGIRGLATLRGGVLREQGFGGLGSGRLEGGTEHVQGLVAGSGGVLDRSGHPLPRSSPSYDSFANNGDLESKHDLARPRNAFAQLTSQLGDHRLSLSGHYMVLDSNAEFLDYGQLTHDNRVVLKAGTLWLDDRWQALPNLSIQGRVAYARGRPGDAEHLSTGSATSYKRRAFGYDAVDAALEGQLTLADVHTITVGSDFTLDHETLMRVYAVNTTTDMEVLEAGSNASRDFHNTGAYAQYRVQVFEGISANVAGRYDHHNIYGDVFTYRAGWVHSIVPSFTYKLLYGTSYRAPTAVQLFGQGLYAGDARGNSKLHPERARTAEIGVEWRVLDELAVLATGCWIEVEDKVEVVERGIIASPQNLAQQRSLCAEGEVKWIHRWSTLLGGISYAHARTRGLGNALFTTMDDQRDTDLYPELMATLRWSVALERFGTVGLALRYAAARRASASNQTANLGEPYELAPYVLADLIYGIWVGDHHFELAGRNLLGQRYAEPGFAGVDVPGRGREITLGYRYRFE